VKVLYVSPVPLQSVAQRPHHFVLWLHQRFKAELIWIETPPIRYPQLSDLHALPRGLSKRRLTAKGQGPLWANEPWIRRMRLPGLPFEPSALGRSLNRLAWHAKVASIEAWLENVGSNGDAINNGSWLVVGRPCQAALYLHQRFPALPLLYDVMDNMAAFYVGASRRWVERCDAALVKLATGILVSSRSLFNRYQASPAPCYLVPNGLAIESQAMKRLLDRPTPLKVRADKRKGLVFGYVGTLASWFDWALIESLCDRLYAQGYERFRIELIGPLHGQLPTNIPPEVVIKPAVAQHLIWDSMKEFDIALIPFKKNELTLFVDPVKFYEYRAAGLPVMSSCFGDMALRGEEDGVFYIESFLEGKIELSSVLRKSHDPEPSFYSAVNWESRFLVIEGIITKQNEVVSRTKAST